MHGTRSIQKLIDCAKTISDRKLIADQLDASIRYLSREINGNHVLVKILQTWDEKQFIFDRLIKECEQIACHKHGCCLMQKGIDAAEGQQQVELMMTVAKNTKLFVRDPFANYVIQYVLSMKKSPKVCEEVGSQLLGSILDLSLEKFSSNVIEKCLEVTTPKVKQEMVLEILQAKSYYPYLMDQYGNYVIQKALAVA